MSNDWYYLDNVITVLPDECVGFVYCITNKINNKKYIGKKLSKFIKTSVKTVLLKNGTKKKKKTKTLVDSDWREYYGSSAALLKDLEILGVNNFRRDILYMCTSKSAASYIEARTQFEMRVCESEDFYNGILNCRIHGSHILNKKLYL